MRDYQLKDQARVNIPARAKIWFELFAPHVPQANSAHCPWEVPTARERIILHTLICRGYKNEVANTSTDSYPRASLRDCSSLLLFFFYS